MAVTELHRHVDCASRLSFTGIDTSLSRADVRVAIYYCRDTAG
jgi:hypothetical protein